MCPVEDVVDAIAAAPPGHIWPVTSSSTSRGHY